MTISDQVGFFKALSDANRLRIVGLLAQRSCSVEQLATTLSLSPSTVSYHLSRLSRARLVSARADGYYSFYKLETKTLDSMAHKLRTQDGLKEFAADVDLKAYDHKVLADTSMSDPSQRMTSTQLKKRRVVLQNLVEPFEIGQRYNEDECRELLGGFQDDAAVLLQELIQVGLLNHDASGYWRVS